MAVLVTRERVQDYGTFRHAFDGADELRRSAGALDAVAYRAEGDPTSVLIVVRFASLAQAHDYNDSAGLREVLNQAGADAAGRRVEFYDEA